MPVDLPVSLYGNSFEPVSLSDNGPYVHRPAVNAWSKYVPNEVESTPEFQRVWRNLEEANRLAQAKSLEQANANGRPHFLVVNPRDYTPKESQFDSYHGWVTPPTSEDGQDYCLSSYPCKSFLLYFTDYHEETFGPVDDWGFQHAVRHRKGEEVSKLDLCVDRWKYSLDFIPLHGQHPGYPPDSDEALFEGWEERLDEEIRSQVAQRSAYEENTYAGPPQVQDPPPRYEESVAEQQRNELAEQQRRELAEQQHSEFEEQQRNALAEQQRNELAEQERNALVEQQRNEFEEQQRNEFEEQQRNEANGLNRAQIVVPQPSEPSDPSRKEVIAAMNGHHVSKRNQNRPKKPVELKPKYVYLTEITRTFTDCRLANTKLGRSRGQKLVVMMVIPLS